MPLSVADLQINVEVGGDAVSALGNIDARLRGVGDTASQHLSTLSKGMYDSVNATNAAGSGVQAFAQKADEAGKKAEEGGNKARDSGGKYDQLGGFAEKSGQRGANGMMALAFATMNAGDTLGPFQNAMNTTMNTLFGASMLAEGWGRKMFIAGGIVSSVGAIGTAMAAQLQDAHAKLTKAVEDTGHAYSDYGAGIDWAQGKAEKLGFTNADFQAGLARTVVATGNTNTALSHMGLVMDIARSQNESLTKAGEDFARIWAGAPMTLRRFGIEASQSGNAAKTLDSSTKALESSYTSYAKAQQRVTELETNAAGAKKLGAAHALALKHAHEELDRATQKLTDAQDKHKKATDASANADSAAEARVQSLGKRIHGTAEEMSNTWGGKFRQMKAVVTDFVAHWGASLGPMLIGVGSLMSGMGALGMSVTLAGVAAASGIGIIVVAIAALLAGAIALFIKWHEVWDFIGQASVPVKILIAALVMLTSAITLPIIAVVALARLIYDNFDSIKNFVVTAWNAIANAAEVAWKWITDTVGKALEAIENWIRPKLQAMQNWWREHGEQVRTIVTTLFNAIRAVVTTVMNVIGTIISTEWSIIQAVFRTAMAIIQPIVTTGFTLMRDVVNTSMGVIQGVISAAWQVIQGVVQAAIAIVVGIITVGLDLLTGKWGQAWDDFKSYASDAIGAIIGAITGFISEIVSTFTNGVDHVKQLWSDAWDALKNGIAAAADAIVGAAEAMISQVLGAFTSMISQMFDIGKNVVMGLVDGIKSAAGSAVDAAKGVVGSAIDGAKSLLHIGSPSLVFMEIGQQTMQGFIDGMVSMMPAIAANAAAIAKYTTDHFKQQLDLWPKLGVEDKFRNWALNNLVDPFTTGNLTVDMGGGLGITGSPGGGSQLTQIINNNVQGSVVTEQDLVRLLRQELISIGRDNGNKVFGGGMFAPA